MRVGLQVVGFTGGAEVGVHDEAVGVELLEVDDAGGDAAGGEVGGGQGACFWLGDGRGALGEGEPGVELGDGGSWVEVGAVELGEGELGGLAVGVVACWGDCFLRSVSLI